MIRFASARHHHQPARKREQCDRGRYRYRHRVRYRRHVDTVGSGYTKPQVVIGTGSRRRDRDGLRRGGIAHPRHAGSGYHVPTVAFDLPDDPNGVMPTRTRARVRGQLPRRVPRTRMARPVR